MSKILKIAPTKSTNYPVLFTEESILAFDIRTVCPVCVSKSQKNAVDIGEIHWTTVISVMQCSDCGHIYYKNTPSNDWMLNYYQKDWMKESDQIKAETQKEITPQYKLANLLAAMDVSPAKGYKIFDVGVGAGGLLKGLKEKGFDSLYGCEQSASRHKIVSREFGNCIYNTGYQGVKTTERFDIIHSNHVLEHIYDPRDFMNWAIEHLNEDGQIVIFVPNAEHESVFGQTFFLPHLHSFTYSSLEALGKEFGFETKFWNDCRADEICSIFYKKLNGTSKAFSKRVDIEKMSRETLFKRLQGPWLERSSNDDLPITLTYHIPNLLNSTSTIFRSYARLGTFSGWYIKQIYSLSRLAQKLGFKSAVRRIPLLLKLISTDLHEVKTIGYITICNESIKAGEVPRVSYKNKAMLLLK